jgi:hypothetical protein
MAYDVFLVSALEDRDAAKLIARRLRALKFKVAFNQKQIDETFDQKDARDAGRSKSVLVLWSENAVRSDWVRAGASIGHSRPGALIEAGLDKAIPYEPFRQNRRISLEGLTSRKTPEGFYQLVEELGARGGRSGLREWMSFRADDEDQRFEWLEAHPSDPLAIDAKKKRDRELGVKPRPAAAAIGAAALAAASMRAASPAASSAQANNKPASQNGAAAALAEAAVGWGTIASVSAAIAGMLILAWVFRSQPALPASSPLPAIANAQLLPAACPAGTFPRALIEIPPLEAGPIIDDTQDEDE